MIAGIIVVVLQANGKTVAGGIVIAVRAVVTQIEVTLLLRPLCDGDLAVYRGNGQRHQINTVGIAHSQRQGVILSLRVRGYIKINRQQCAAIGKSIHCDSAGGDLAGDVGVDRQEIGAAVDHTTSVGAGNSHHACIIVKCKIYRANRRELLCAEIDMDAVALGHRHGACRDTRTICGIHRRCDGKQ